MPQVDSAAGRAALASAAGGGAAPCSERRRRLRVLCFTGLLLVVAALLTCFVLTSLPGHEQPRRHVLVLFVGAFLAAEMLAVHLHVGRATLTCSFSEIPLVVALAFLHPLAVVAVKLLGAGPVIAVGRLRRPTKLVFNLALVWLETVLAVIVWHTVLGGSSAYGPRGWLAALAVLVTTDVYASVAIGVVMRLDEARTGRQNLPEFLAGSVAALANVSLAVLVIALVAVDWRATWALAVLIAVLAAAYRSYSVLRRRHDALERLTASTSDVAGDLRTDRVADAVLRQVALIVDADVAELDWWGGDASVPLHVALRGGHPVASEVSVGAAFGPPGDEPLLVPRNVRDKRLREALTATGLRDAVVVPLVVEGRVLGTLTVGDREGDVVTFSGEDRSLVQALANHAVVALANAELADQLRNEADQRSHEALHDALTGLPNRNLFRERLAEHLTGGQRLAVLLLDLDRFKEVNDTLGHHLGDELLKHVANRLIETVPPGAVVARLGGDEFTVMLPGVEEGEAALVVSRLRAGLLRPFATGDLTLNTDCSVGIALSPQHGQDLDVLLQRADVAMYAAKADRSGFSVYAPERDQYSPRRLALVTDLRSAISNGDLQVHYQPKVDLATGAAVGVEALVRWNHSAYGFVPPDDFLPIAEQTDLMLPLTSFVLRRALADTVAWERAGLAVDVAVNLSPRVLLEPHLLDLVAAELRDAALPATRLTLEITEGSVIADPTRAIAVLDQLDAMGVRLSIDDFGTGYSSLSYLGRLPVQEVKIDKSFIFRITDVGVDAAIVQSTVDLAHRLGMSVVAEGVETAEALSMLRGMHCDVAQGYLLSRPVPAAALLEWAQQWASTSAARVEAWTDAETARSGPVALPRQASGEPAAGRRRQRGRDHRVA